jgi:Flp pilus assembly protein TadG
MPRHLRFSHGGNAILEMAIVLPLLIVLVMGMAEFAQFFYVKNTFQEAAREVARMSVPASAVKADPATAATSALARINVPFTSSWMTIIDLTHFTLVSDVSTIPAGDVFTVIIQQNYDLIPGTYRPLYLLTGQGIGNGKSITGQSTAVKE